MMEEGIEEDWNASLNFLVLVDCQIYQESL